METFTGFFRENNLNFQSMQYNLNNIHKTVLRPKCQNVFNFFNRDFRNGKYKLSYMNQLFKIVRFVTLQTTLIEIVNPI